MSPVGHGQRCLPGCSSLADELDDLPNAERRRRPDPERPLDSSLANAIAEPTPTPSPGLRSIERLDPVECMCYLRTRRVGRLGFVEGGWPVVLPVNYRVTDDGEIIFKSVVGSKTVAADRSVMACFEVDDIDQSDRPMWSVVAQGKLGIVSSPHEFHTAWQNDPEPWINGEEWAWLRLVPLSVSGRRIAAADRAPAPE